MNEEDRDIVEFTDEEGNSILLEVLDTFYYNGEEFAVLADYVEDEEDDGETAACDCAQSEGCACCGGWSRRSRSAPSSCPSRTVCSRCSIRRSCARSMPTAARS